MGKRQYSLNFSLWMYYQQLAASSARRWQSSHFGTQGKSPKRGNIRVRFKRSRPTAPTWSAASNSPSFRPGTCF